MHTQKLEFKGQTVQKIKWKQTDATDWFTFQANAVRNQAMGLIIRETTEKTEKLADEQTNERYSAWYSSSHAKAQCARVLSRVVGRWL